MADNANYPIPEGVSASFSYLAAGVNTATFALPEKRHAVVTFQPLDTNNPGTLTLYDSNANVILTTQTGGYTPFQVPPGGLSYYFSASAGARLVAATLPNSLR